MRGAANGGGAVEYDVQHAASCGALLSATPRSNESERERGRESGGSADASGADASGADASGADASGAHWLLPPCVDAAQAARAAPLARLLSLRRRGAAPRVLALRVPPAARRARRRESGRRRRRSGRRGGAAAAVGGAARVGTLRPGRDERRATARARRALFLHAAHQLQAAATLASNSPWPSALD